MKEVKIGKDKISVALCTYNGEKFIRGIKNRELNAYFKFGMPVGPGVYDEDQQDELRSWIFSEAHQAFIRSIPQASSSAVSLGWTPMAP